jgi:hypothetical protein
MITGGRSNAKDDQRDPDGAKAPQPWCPLTFIQQNLHLCTYVGLRGVRWTYGLASRPAPTAPSEKVTDGVNTLRGAELMALVATAPLRAATSTMLAPRR